ncbi:MAG TPA: glycerate kinase [Lachnospiraceae bacterium]|jgi:glycerate kinase|nr:glycerate kinase [Lachnospiraceae bacterium]
MHIVIAMDSFKGSMSSLETGNAVAEGFRRVNPDNEIDVRPVADGGEGTVDTLTEGLGGTFRTVKVTGPLGKVVEAKYGITENPQLAEHFFRRRNREIQGASGMKMLKYPPTAIIETAQAAGLTLVPEKSRNPMLTTTRGVGELIRDAISQGCRNFIIGIGSSATNDCGIGMLEALGFKFLDENGVDVPGNAAGLARVASIDATSALPELADCSFQIACDVTNPLCGEKGASAVFGPQKGADPEMIRQMDAAQMKFAELCKKTYPKADPTAPGTGAAGGLGFGFLTFTNAILARGIDIVLRETRLESYLRSADLVVTGEGELDARTMMGKGPSGVAALAKNFNVPCIAFTGQLGRNFRTVNDKGIAAFFTIQPGPVSLSEAMDNESARRHLADTAEQVMRLIDVFYREKWM